MYIKISKDQKDKFYIETKWVSRPLKHKNLTEQQLNALGIYETIIPDLADPYVKSNYTITVSTGVPVVTGTSTPISILQAKRLKKQEIESAWKNSLTNGKFISSVIEGFEVDCRRYDVDNDPQNIAGKIKRIEAGVEQVPVYWKGVTETKSLTLLELKSLELEMLDYADTSYNKKFLAGIAIDAATTIEEIKDISF